MSDVQKYIEKRRRSDVAFAEGFESGYSNFKMGIFRQEQDDLRPEYDLAKLLKKFTRSKYAKMNTDSFPPEAWARWTKIPEQAKQLLLTNVWCSHCQATTTILNFSGQVVQGDLVISGVCSRCGGKVARLIESE